MPEYHISEIRKMAETLRTKAGHFGQVGDALPKVDDDKAFGALENSGQVVSGVHGSLTSFGGQFGAAETHLKNMSEALARAADMLQDQDDAAGKALAPAPETQV